MDKRDNRQVNRLLETIKIPKMILVKQNFESACIDDLSAVLLATLSQAKITNTIKKGMTIAITAGSRGIENIDKITKMVVEFVKEQGAEPFIIPAMGSHGGAMEQGQIDILKSFHITSETMGCPIKATMEVDLLAVMQDGTPVYIDKYAHEADGIIVINRIKPHTGFRGSYESGLFKMMTIGLGKQKGAETAHKRGRKKMGETIEFGGNAYLDHANILFGVAIIENAFDKTYKIEALTPTKIKEKEPLYLQEAKKMLPQILFDNLDILIIDYMGKNISGTGMDPNITKSFSYESGISREGRAKKIVVLDLTEQSHGAAVGLGMADITTIRMFEKMDFNTTYPNLLTTGGTDSAKIPMMFDNHKLAIQASIKTAIGSDIDNLRIVRLKDTLHLSEIQVSPALLKEAKAHPYVDIIGDEFELKFDENGNLFK